MKIAIDGYELGRRASGVGRVTHNLVTHLQDVLSQDSFVVFTKEKLGLDLAFRCQEYVLPRRGGYLRWQNGPLRRALRREKSDVFMAPNYILPLFYQGESLLFEHDISVIVHPEWYTRRYTLPRRFLISASLARARRVVVPSEFTKGEILSRFPIDPLKILVCRYGVEEKFCRVAEEDCLAWKKKRGVDGKVIVGFLGALNRRRHLPLLVRAVELLRKDRPEVVLFLVGREVGSFSKTEIARLLSPEWVFWEPELPEEELPHFYSSLDVFAYLSEYEGFGFPPLEALACGTPVVLLARSSLEEIFSGLAFMVENVEAEEVARVLARALEDTVSRVRQLASFKERRNEFSWQRAALAIAHLLQNWPTG